MPGLPVFRKLSTAGMENTTAIAPNTAHIQLYDGRTEQRSGRGTKYDRGQIDRRQFAEKMAIAAGYSDQCSSGSEHEPDSGCLVDMVVGFMEESEYACYACTAQTASDLAEDRCSSDPAILLQQNQQYHSNEYEMLQGIGCSGCPAELILMDETVKALQMASSAGKFPENEESKCRKRRTVMNHLRNAGYNAAICKSRGKHTGSFPAGDYEYIDVVMMKKEMSRDTDIIDNTRFVVDIDFRAQFEIARPTGEYSALVQLLPDIFVGKPERLQQIVKVMCVAAKRSLKKNGMHLPPWRKHKYMQSKWLGPYKRTTNPVLKAQQPLSAVPKGTYNEFRAHRNFVEYQMGGAVAAAIRDGKRRSHQCVHEGDDVDGKVMNPEVSASCYSEEISPITGWNPPKPSVERHGRVYSGLANALKDAHAVSTSQLHLAQDRIALTVF